ncbi:hypothetical protein HJG60_010600 [Phyllostomus discolor]|uniref:Uncharacterized protein n=1 Tax=Phyllostomus discolor TaxID=89673 RepID=A0A834EBD9_9CHIR|nr:hypothetical protein HJG60_010600 [Phyllostomus discolor]
MEPQTPLAQLMDVAFSVFINRDLEERQAKLLALALSGDIGYSQSPQDNLGSHKDVEGARIKCALSANALDTGQKNALSHPQGHVPSAKEQTLIPGTGRVTAPIPRVERGHLLWPWQHLRTEGAQGAGWPQPTPASRPLTKNPG